MVILSFCKRLLLFPLCIIIILIVDYKKFIFYTILIKIANDYIESELK